MSKRAKIEIGSVAQFEEVVLESKEPVLVQFHARFSMDCDLTTFVVDQAIRMGNIAAATVDFMAFPELRRRYEVLYLPMLIVFKDGKEVARQKGIRGYDAILAWIQQHT